MAQQASHVWKIRRMALSRLFSLQRMRAARACDCIHSDLSLQKYSTTIQL